MIIYNTTFHIEKDVHDEGLDYLKKHYIPQVIASGFLQSPGLRRVMQTEEDEGYSYSVQFCVKNVETLDYWLQTEGTAIHKELVARFGHKIAGFSTLLEEINWEK
ncbi:DUF4286 family protein [Parabacteroides bouchesdurhonensis]|uniref:DUF4286 family protein n=1 Tax=Parabacteroides bouchesdurhonensis TaxID=1936995 RepID=UPI000C824C95|nr:DUF4286 family protein [Parabacteroides bouchesdurhonensis]RHJ91101.1 DUF4286 family protein [Bacteroides sp. AM07-16]